MNDVPLVELLPSADEAGAYSLPAALLDTLAQAARELQFLHRRIDLLGCGDKGVALDRIAQALEFPDWFGRNWDALADCLSDLEWLEPADGYVLALDNIQELREASLDDYATLIEVLDDVAGAWRDHAVPFWSFLCDRDADDSVGDGLPSEAP